MALDETDVNLLRLLTEDGRAPLRRIAKELGVSTVTVSKRLRKLRESGIIEGFTVVVDSAKLGYDLTTLINIHMPGKYSKEVGNKIAQYSNVLGVYNVSGEYATTLLAKFKNRQALGRFVEKIANMEHVERTNTQVVIHKLKENFRPVI